MRKLTTPLTEEDVKSLHAGDHVLLSGVVYTARDAAHLRMMDLIRAGKPLPVDLAGIPPPRRFCSTVCAA